MAISMDYGSTGVIVRECAKAGLLLEQTAYVLATAYHETARQMEPIKETVMPHHKNKNPSDKVVAGRLQRAFDAGRLSWVSAPYWHQRANGERYFGRGFVQLTHQSNYKKMGDLLGVDLVGNPSLALSRDIAAKILVLGMRDGHFTGVRLPADPGKDLRRARAVVNGDRLVLADFYHSYLDMLKQHVYAPRSATRSPKLPRKDLAIPGAILAIGAAIALFLDEVKTFFSSIFGG